MRKPFEDTSDYSFGYIAGWSSGRDTKELKQELTGESKNHQGDERHDRGPSDNRFPLMVIHTIGHGQENRHRTEWIGQRKKRSET